MKKLIISLLVVTAFVAAPVSLFAQGTATATANDARVQVLDDIEITNSRDLNFGQLYTSSLTTGGVITMAGNSAGTITGSNSSAVVTGTSTSAQFDVVGSANANYTITLPSTTVELTGQSTGTKIPLTSFTTAVTSPLLDENGLQTFYVGATLTIPTTMPGGDNYTGAYDVTVAYQ